MFLSLRVKAYIFHMPYGLSLGKTVSRFLAKLSIPLFSAGEGWLRGYVGCRTEKDLPLVFGDISIFQMLKSHQVRTVNTYAITWKYMDAFMHIAHRRVQLKLSSSLFLLELGLNSLECKPSYRAEMKYEPKRQCPSPQSI